MQKLARTELRGGGPFPGVHARPRQKFTRSDQIEGQHWFLARVPGWRTAVDDPQHFDAEALGQFLKGLGRQWFLERIHRWRSAAGQRQHIDVEALVPTLDRLRDAGFPAGLAEYVVLGCEWLFRLRDFGRQDVQRLLDRVRLALEPIMGTTEACVVTEALAPQVRKQLRRHRQLAAVLELEPPRMVGLTALAQGPQPSDLGAEQNLIAELKTMREQIAQMQTQTKDMEDQDRLAGMMGQVTDRIEQVSLRIEQCRTEILRPAAAAAGALHAGTPIEPVIPVRSGPAPWLAPWVAGLIAERLTERKASDGRGLGLSLTAALLGRDIEESEYRVRRNALKGVAAESEDEEPVLNQVVRDFEGRYQLLAGLDTRDLEHRCQFIVGLKTPLRLRWPDHWQMVVEDHLQVLGPAGTFPFDVKVVRSLYAAYRS